MKTIHRILTVVFAGLVLTFVGCKDFVTINAPIDRINTETIYSSDETATAAVRGIYSRLADSHFANGNSYSITMTAGRSADDFTNITSDDNLIRFSTNDLLADNAGLRVHLWQAPYQVIYSANSVLENLNKSTAISNELKQRLIGEAKFVRAFCHFYLTNLFGEIPVILTTDYKTNALSFANSKEQIYQQIIKDLVEAKSQLPEEYPTTERIRANKWAATALLSRVYLYNQDWTNAEIQASEIIANTGRYNLVSDLNSVFLKNSQETILQLVMPPLLLINTYEGFLFILNQAPGSTTNVSLSQNLITAFEPGDVRLTKWTGTFASGTKTWYFPYKYKIKSGNPPSNEYSMVLRLAEQYLIRAEARIQLNKISSGIVDLNFLRTRARALPTPSVPNPLPALLLTLNKQDALLAVEKERRIELFSEWGHRWLDLKRTNRADAVLEVLKSPTWESTDVLYPIPATELVNAINIKQNPGYH